MMSWSVDLRRAAFRNQAFIAALFDFCRAPQATPSQPTINRVPAAGGVLERTATIRGGGPSVESVSPRSCTPRTLQASCTSCLLAAPKATAAERTQVSSAAASGGRPLDSAPEPDIVRAT